MQTAAIRYRVTDFLKQHPPFQLMEEPDLLALVAHGRVKFHEEGEFLCWQSSAYAPLLFVIQQGAVSLWEENDGREILRDMCGPGDIIGLERFLGSSIYPYSAKAAEEVVVYGLPATDFEPLLRKYAHAARFVESYSTAGAIFRQANLTGAHERFVAELARHPEPLSCGSKDTVAEAARRMRAAGSDAIAVMRDRNLQGLLTAGDVLEWIGAGGSPLQAVQEMMSGAPPAVSPQALVSDCVLAMTNAKSGVIALTADGTPAGGLLRLVSAADLQPAFGDNPAVLLQAVHRASGVEVLRALHSRFRTLVLEQLSEPSAVDWLTELADRFNTSLLARLIDLAAPSQPDWCWCFWGAAGRQELLSAAEPGLAVLCPDDRDVSLARATLERLHSDLIDCGYLSNASPQWESGMLCASLHSWERRFAAWIRDPILNRVYAARPLFDLRPIFRPAEAWQRLQSSVQREMQSEPAFQSLLANDSLSQLPPLTFFQDAVVDERGERANVFALEQSALGPIVDVARVFALTHGRILGAPTLDRLALARSRMPAHQSMIREAEETFRVLLYLEAREGLRHGTTGAELAPNQISRADRQALKSGFRAIHQLLEFTANQTGPEIP